MTLVICCRSGCDEADAKVEPLTAKTQPATSPSDTSTRTHEFLNTMYCNPAPWGTYYGYVPDELDAFVRCVADGKPALVDGRAGLEAVRIAKAMHQSAETGQNVNL